MEEEEKTYKEIELRSEEVQEIMNKPPSWIMRWGIVLMLCVIMILLVGSYLIKYPESIVANITITTSNPPVDIIARSTGKIDEIFVKNKIRVLKNSKLAVIQNPAKTTDMLLLVDRLNYWKKLRYDISIADSLLVFSSISLGSIQASYSVFLRDLSNLQQFIKNDYYNNRIRLLTEKNKGQKDYYNMMIRQKQLAEEQFKTTQSIFSRDSMLFTKNISTGNEYDVARNSYIQSRQTYLSYESSLKQSEIQFVAEKEVLLEILNQANEIENNYRLALLNSTEQLQAEIKTWESIYLLKSPVDGIVNFIGIWSKNQNVSSGETVFSVLPLEKGDSKGKALLPAQGAGKVKVGQRVNVRISNFPDQQFGYLIGSISSISNTTNSEGFYILEVDFPNGLKTNYGTSLPNSQQMSGSAEIITNDLRVIERFFQPIRKFLNR